MRKIHLLLLLLPLIITACGKKETGPKKPAKDDRQAVMVEELTLRPLDDFISVSGKLEGITDLTMSSETSGRILQLYKRLGDRISKGERLGKVENDILQIRLDQAEAALLSAETSLDNARRNLSYAEASKAKNLISEAEYNTALTAFKGAKAGFDGAKAAREAARLAYDNSYLLAPETGVISNLMVSAGQYINPGTPIAKITDSSSLILKTGVGETLIGKLAKGQAAEIKYIGSERKFTGRIRGFGISPITNTATYAVEIEVAPQGVLMPGMVVSAKILTQRYKDLLYTAIPNISKEFGRNYLYVVEGDKAVKKEVQLGRIIGENVEISSGVEAGEVIVTTGAENLEDGSPVQIRK